MINFCLFVICLLLLKFFAGLIDDHKGRLETLISVILFYSNICCLSQRVVVVGASPIGLATALMLAQFPGVSVMVVDHISAHDFEAKKLELYPVAIHKSILHLKNDLRGAYSKYFVASKECDQLPDAYVYFSQGNLLDRLYRSLQTRSNVAIRFGCAYRSTSGRYRTVSLCCCFFSYD